MAKTQFPEKTLTAYLRRLVSHHGLLELLALLAVLSLRSPYQGKSLDVIDNFNANAIHTVNVALGFVKRGHYPCYSAPFTDFLRENIPKGANGIFSLDLIRSFPKELWPDNQFEIPSFMGSESGMVFGIIYLWKITGVYTLGIIVASLQTLHFAGIFGLFLLVSTLRIRGAALLLSLIYAYSSEVTKTIITFSPYALAPNFCILSTLLIALNVRGTDWKANYVMRIFCVASAGILIGLGSIARTSILLTGISLLFVISLHACRTKRWRDIFLCGVLLAALASSRYWGNQLIWTSDRLAFNHTKDHLFWHSLWAGLGEFPNPYGFRWSDVEVFRYVLNHIPSVQIGSQEYESFLKADLLHKVSHHPLWYISVLCRRFLQVLKNWPHLISTRFVFPAPLAMVLGSFSLYGGLFFLTKNRDLTGTAVILPPILDIVIPLFVYSSFDYYNLTTYLGILIALVYALAKTSTLMRSRLSGKVPQTN